MARSKQTETLAFAGTAALVRAVREEARLARLTPSAFVRGLVEQWIDARRAEAGDGAERALAAAAARELAVVLEPAIARLLRRAAEGGAISAAKAPVADPAGLTTDDDGAAVERRAASRRN